MQSDVGSTGPRLELTRGDRSRIIASRAERKARRAFSDDSVAFRAIAILQALRRAKPGVPRVRPATEADQANFRRIFLLISGYRELLEPVSEVFVKVLTCLGKVSLTLA